MCHMMWVSSLLLEPPEFLKHPNLTCIQFPRIVVDLSPEHLELSDECVRDILDLTKENRNEFYRKYGMSFDDLILVSRCICLML
jgi:hypothetical protein